MNITCCMGCQCIGLEKGGFTVLRVLAKRAKERRAMMKLN